MSIILMINVATILPLPAKGNLYLKRNLKKIESKAKSVQKKRGNKSNDDVVLW